MKKTAPVSREMEEYDDIAAIESLLFWIERELRDLCYELAARQCRMVKLAIIDQDLRGLPRRPADPPVNVPQP